MSDPGTPATTAGPPRGAARPTVVLLVTSAAAFLSSLDLFIVNIAFPEIRADFPASDLAEVSWVLNGYTVVFAAFLAPAGRLADRFGHRGVFLTGLAVFTLASLACAFSPSVWALVAARTVQALGAALVTPTSLSLLLAAYPPERRGRAVGTWASIGAVAAALGPPLGGLLVQSSWHWVFIVNVPVGVLALIAGARVLRDTDRAASGTPDLVGALLLVLGVGALALVLVQGPDLGWTSAPIFVAGVVCVVGLAWTLHRARRHPVPALDLSVLGAPTVGFAALAMLAFTAAFSAMLVINVLYLTGGWGWSAGLAGLALAPGPAVVVVVARFASRFTDRFSTGRVTAAGSVLFAVGPAWWLLRLDTAPDYLTGLLPGQLFTGIGVGLILPTLSAVVGSALPSHQWGSGSALINTARQVGSVLGVALLVSVIGAEASGRPDEIGLVRAGWILIVLCTLVSLGCAIGLAVAERRASGLRSPPPTTRASDVRARAAGVASQSPTDGPT